MFSVPTQRNSIGTLTARATHVPRCHLRYGLAGTETSLGARRQCLRPAASQPARRRALAANCVSKDRIAVVSVALRAIEGDANNKTSTNTQMRTQQTGVRAATVDSAD